jgi:hypothetical protein
MHAAVHLAFFRRVLFVCAAFAAACDDGPSGQPSGPDGGSTTEPVSLVGTRVWTPDGEQVTSYVHEVAALSSQTELDLDRALELPGAVSLYAMEDVGWFAIGGGEDPTITRFERGEGGQMVERESISFQPYGVISLWQTMIWLSPTKAYYPDRDGAQIIVWNPSAMEITGVIDLGVARRPDALAYLGLTPVVRGTRVLLSVGWFDWSEADRILPETGLIVIDSEDDELVRFDVDSRCGGISEAIQLDSGDAYLVSSALAGAAFALERLDTPPCALRIPAGADAIDPEELVSLEELTGWRITGEPVPAGGSAIFLRALDPELANIEEGAFTYDVTAQLAWRWLRWDVDAGEVAEVDELEPAAADGYWFAVDDRVVATRATADYAETTLVDLTADGGPAPLVTLPGFVFAITSVSTF